MVTAKAAQSNHSIYALTTRSLVCVGSIVSAVVVIFVD